MKKILTEIEIKDFLSKYCPGTTLTCRIGVMYVENKEIGILRETNGSNVSLKCIAYEYAFTKYAIEKFDYVEFPTHIYRTHTEPGVEFSLAGQEIQCDAYVVLARAEQKHFEITLDNGLRLCGEQQATYLDDIYRVTLSRVDGIDPLDTVEDIQELARDLVDEMFEQLSEYSHPERK
jgi:hypothetical protein